MSDAEFVYEDGEWWYVGYKDSRLRADVYKQKNNARMYVNGKYIPVSHPLYKPGRYKSFDEAAFSSLAQ